jgi:hypothetical protein
VVQRAYVVTSRALSALLCLLGLAMAVISVARGGGPMALGVLVGLAFAVLGAARLWLARGAAPREGR